MRPIPVKANYKSTIVLSLPIRRNQYFQIRAAHKHIRFYIRRCMIDNYLETVKGLLLQIIIYYYLFIYLFITCKFTHHLARGLIVWGWLRMNVGFIQVGSKKSPTNWRQTSHEQSYVHQSVSKHYHASTASRQLSFNAARSFSVFIAQRQRVHVMLNHSHKNVLICVNAHTKTWLPLLK